MMCFFYVVFREKTMLLLAIVTASIAQESANPVCSATKSMYRDMACCGGEDLTSICVSKTVDFATLQHTIELLLNRTATAAPLTDLATRFSPIAQEVNTPGVFPPSTTLLNYTYAAGRVKLPSVIHPIVFSVERNIMASTARPP
jgi:hypothetical protein